MGTVLDLIWSLLDCLFFQILGDSEASLVLSLKHPRASVRVSAVEHLMGLLTSGQV